MTSTDATPPDRAPNARMAGLSCEARGMPAEWPQLGHNCSRFLAGLGVGIEPEEVAVCGFESRPAA